jgi:hypothetical protein
LSRGETEFPLLLFFLASRCLGGSISWRLDLPLHPKIKKQRLAAPPAAAAVQQILFFNNPVFRWLQLLLMQ